MKVRDFGGSGFKNLKRKVLLTVTFAFLLVLQMVFSSQVNASDEPFAVSTANNMVFQFQGINVDFNRNIVVPTDWSGIQLLDGNGQAVAIDRVNLTNYPNELQIYSKALLNSQTYTLVIAPNTISDTEGNKYTQEIQINFSCNVPS
ncbi:Ig-like domain-containing protein [Desulfosporosinus sp. PR]|uniref:Ig-like domain-containing protein n=1 Tax=Candidatus Desulfosporosinus nitrosoreducens TaxID=3401928 RepID=UPI0027ED056B|nr:Ig-like domain-containing protein [Desulfosporosinus sp. PR]MDQ7096991.1 Ig-like domain-containing protein [Desulfosporosinus sp. PR]